MRIPSKVKVGAYTYKIVWVKDLQHGDVACEGLCKPGELAIYLNKKLKSTPDRLDDTFLHECLHAIEDAHNIKLGESKVTSLATALLAFLKDNKLLKEESDGRGRRGGVHRSR